jgi:hypothetical protein
MPPRVVKGDQKGHRGITSSVRKLLKTTYVIPPTRGRTGGVVFHIDFRISGCRRAAREGAALSRGGEWVALECEPPMGPNTHAEA